MKGSSYIHLHRDTHTHRGPIKSNTKFLPCRTFGACAVTHTGNFWQRNRASSISPMDLIMESSLMRRTCGTGGPLWVYSLEWTGAPNSPHLGLCHQSPFMKTFCPFGVAQGLSPSGGHLCFPTQHFSDITLCSPFLPHQSTGFLALWLGHPSWHPAHRKGSVKV